MPAAARKFESFSLDPAGQFIYAGDVGGRITTLRAEDLTDLSHVQAHNGVVMAVAAHPTLPFVAALSTDRRVSLWRLDDDRVKLSPLAVFCVRDVLPSNEAGVIEPVHSTSQALSFHDTAPRLVTRSGNAAVLELAFDENGDVDIIHCTRLHDEWDLISARYVIGSDDILTGSRGGLITRSRNGTMIGRWQVGEFTIHWAEPVADGVYLLASDSRFVARFDLNDPLRSTLGPIFTRDDLEHVTYSEVSGRAYVASFDRNIYEVDPISCEPIGIVFHAPFKCRWVDVLPGAPEMLVVQCRDGSLHKVDVASGQAVRSIRRTPSALWSAAPWDTNSLVFAGEGRKSVVLTAGEGDSVSAQPSVAVSEMVFTWPAEGYVKRMAVAEDGTIAAVHLNGSIALSTAAARDDGWIILPNVHVPGGTRDAAFGANSNELYVASEDGHVYVVDLADQSVTIFWKSSVPLPVWALNYCQSRHALALAERYGSLFIIDCSTGKTRRRMQDVDRCKRMKWLSENEILFGSTGCIHRYNVDTGDRIELVQDLGNTVEDFIWDTASGYLLAITYQCTVALCDLANGRLLNLSADQIDYSKGLAWLPGRNLPDRYSLDFVTFGRSGGVHLFRVHDEKVLAMGPIGGLQSAIPALR